ncbi:MAG: pilin [Candidatus Saccharimonadales bacterium]
MLSFAHTGLSLLADTSGAISVMRDYIRPTIQMLAGLASIACTLFLVHGGYLYMTSRGNPESLETAKRVVRNALIGLVIVLGAMTLTTILSGAYGNPSNVGGANLPNLQAIQPQDAGSGLVEVLIKAVTGFLNNIIQTIGAPFLSALDFFTKGTPLMAQNPGVFNLWLAVVGITDVLFILIVALLGFHVMSAASLGLDEIEFKHLLPRIGLAFLLVNTSIFVIDFVIELSNVLINAITKVTGATSVWVTLTAVVKESGGQSAAALLVMIAFLIFSVILLIYYVGRLVVLFLGAVLSPLVIGLSLLPSFRDFSVTAARTYVTTIFVLFVHVVTLELAATLFVGLSATDGNNGLPNVLMSMVIGLATVLTLLKTQGVMMQFGYVSLGARNARKLGSQFMNGVSYLTGKGQAAVSSVSSKASSGAAAASSKSTRTTTQTNTGYKQPKNMNTQAKTSTQRKRPETGTTIEAPKVTPRSEATNAKLAKSKKEEK